MGQYSTAASIQGSVRAVEIHEGITEQWDAMVRNKAEAVCFYGETFQDSIPILSDHEIRPTLAHHSVAAMKGRAQSDLHPYVRYGEDKDRRGWTRWFWMAEA